MSFPIVERPTQNVWREVNRQPMRGDPRFVVRYSMARESLTKRPGWSISILERGRGCDHERHLPSDCQAAPAVVVRVFHDAAIARRAWDAAKRGQWGELFALPGAPWQAPRELRSYHRTPQAVAWQRATRASPEGSGIVVDDEPLRIEGSSIAESRAIPELVKGTWVEGTE